MVRDLNSNGWRAPARGIDLGDLGRCLRRNYPALRTQFPARLKDVLAVMTRREAWETSGPRLDVKKVKGRRILWERVNRSPAPLPLCWAARQLVHTRARGEGYEINSVYAREQDESGALSSLVWALGACKGMMQSRSGAVQLKATIHHCRTRQGRNSLIHRYTLFLPCALRSSLSLSHSFSLCFSFTSSPTLSLSLRSTLDGEAEKGTILGPSTPLDRGST